VKVLSGDIGGTNTRLALLELGKGKPAILREERYSSTEFGSLEEILGLFLDRTGAPVADACFGLAGPVRNNRCRTTNLAWNVEGEAIRRELGFSQVALINDLEAMAWGIAALESDGLLTLQQGSPIAVGNRMVIAAGTGLGEAGIHWDGSRYHPFATEGGHTDFSPGNELEFRLFQYLEGLFGHVSWERLVSGPGLVNIYRFLLQLKNSTPPAWLTDEMRNGDPAAAISRTALADRDLICNEALTLFVRLYGREAGNQALKQMATGGVYIGGGIAPKILERLQQPAFLNAFRSKGRMSALTESMPVHVILDENTSLYGPACYLQRINAD
jgi:glucokinase